MNLNCKIEFHSYWHCGSGLAAGAGVDALVVKDEDGLPFVPGKTIKGLLREAVVEIAHIEDIHPAPELFGHTFGYFDGDTKEMRTAESFFENLVLPKMEHDSIVAGQLAEYMYKSVSATAIDSDGIAVKHSLRKMEVCVPCTLAGRILSVPDEMGDVLMRAAGFVKQLGQGRTRGLGRCTITIEKEDVL